LNGVIHLIKPPGMTSSNVVVAVKKICNVKKTGHTGTLDPGACGVLSVCVGRATKIADYLMESRKIYIAGVRFGSTTDTLDSYGRITHTSSGRATPEALKSACAAYTGEQSQVPPMYSAIKVNGQKMYDIARQGREIELAPRQITVYAIDMIEMDEAAQTCLLRIECSGGTYIRTLCAELAKQMGTLGYISFLLRSHACNTDVSQCRSLDEIASMAAAGDHSFLIPADSALADFPQCTLEDYLFPIVTTGSPIDLSRIKNGDAVPRQKELRVYCKGVFVGMGYCQDNLLTMKTMYYINQKESE